MSPEEMDRLMYGNSYKDKETGKRIDPATVEYTPDGIRIDGKEYKRVSEEDELDYRAAYHAERGTREYVERELLEARRTIAALSVVADLARSLYNAHFEHTWASSEWAQLNEALQALQEQGQEQP